MQKEIIFIGLGRMGAAMTEHLVEEGYTVHGFDVSPEARATAAGFGVDVHDSIGAAISHMEGKKVVWMMVPSKFVNDVLQEVTTKLTTDDIIIDGGNTFFKETLARAETTKAKGIHYVDCGTSGGVDGARHGASLMIGGDNAVVREIEHIFTTLAAPGGYGHVGKSGAGHFVKMVHNGIEYGMMGAIAEGVNFIESEQPDLEIDVQTALKPYENGSIISSSLMGWLADSFTTNGYLEQIAGEVPQGETEMEMEYIVEQAKTPVLNAALEQRKATRKAPSRTGTFISAMRNQFGGHKTIKKD
ncbi:MAG: 6-phosphogluconate dehydrogenase [Candidatus Paceibacteria bacterium]|jgi:6-phosphogluconate dehydrogenase